MGHISPLAAYNAETDSFLILDVAAYKYPPVWVSTEDLWDAMSASVGSSPRTRGFIVVREGAAGRPAPLSLGRTTLPHLTAGITLPASSLSRTRSFQART
jgi:hypothetical protein